MEVSASHKESMGSVPRAVVHLPVPSPPLHEVLVGSFAAAVSRNTPSSGRQSSPMARDMRSRKHERN